MASANQSPASIPITDFDGGGCGSGQSPDDESNPESSISTAIGNLDISPENVLALQKKIEEFERDKARQDLRKNILSETCNVDARGSGAVFVGNTYLSREHTQGQTQRFMEECKRFVENDFVETEQSKSALSQLQTHNIVFIVGRPGDGKTSLAKFLIYRSFADEYGVVEIDSCKQWRKAVALEEKKTVFIDEIFGGNNPKADVEMWLKLHDDIRTCLKRGFLRLVITCSKQAYNEASISSTKPLFSQVFDLTKNKLSLTEKKDILFHHLKLKGRDCSILKGQQFLVLGNDIIGFPLCCQMFTENENIFKFGLKFFENPKEYINELIRHLYEHDTMRYCVLVFCMLSGRELTDATFDLTEMEETQRRRNQTILDACGCDSTVTVKMIQKAADSLLHTYIIRNAANDGFVFQHFAYMSSVAERFSKNNNNVILEYGDILYISNNISDNGPIRLTRDKFHLLILRFLKVELNTLQIIMLNSAIFRHFDFLLTFLLHLRKLGDLLVFLRHNDFEMMKRNLFSLPKFCNFALRRIRLCSGKQTAIDEMKVRLIIDGMIFGTGNKMLLDVLCDGKILKYLQRMTKCGNDDGFVARRCLSFLLLWVCVNHNTSLVAELLAEGADPNIRGLCELTPLHCASELGLNDIVTLLVNQGAKQSGTVLNLYPLHCAAMRGNTDVINTLIDHGADISVRDVTDSTPIFAASFCDHTHAVDLLLKHGANANDRCGSCRMPIHVAAINGNADIFNNLLIYQANIDAKDEYGWTPLMLAAHNGYTNMVKTLIKHHSRISVGLYTSSTSTLTHAAFIDATNNDGWTALHHSVFFDHTNVMEVLLDENASTSTTSESRDTPLHIAAIRGHVDSVKYLIKRNASLSMKNNVGFSPLHAAVNMGHVHVVDLLLTEGADKFTQDKSGCSFLHSAADSERIDMVECLIKHGCKTDIMDNVGNTPLHVASCRGNSKIATVLLNHGAGKFANNFDGMSALHFACLGSNTEVMDMLLKSGFNTRDTDLHGNTVLHHAAAFGSVKSFIFFNKCLVDQLLRNRAGRTALHEAAFVGHLEMVTAIIQCVSDLKRNASATGVHGSVHNLRAQELVSLRDKCGNTALQLAAYNGHSQTVAFLYEHGADLLTRDKKGNVVKHSAFTCGGKLPHIDCSINSNVKGETPHHISTWYMSIKIV